jgi:hypothetical protein
MCCSLNCTAGSSHRSAGMKFCSVRPSFVDYEMNNPRWGCPVN